MSIFRTAQPTLFAVPPSHAPWPVWRDSTTKPVKFPPLKKAKAAQLYRKARAHDRRTHERGSGKHGGALGRTALNVLQTLLFDFQNYTTGRLDPSIDAIALKAGCGATAVKNALKKLKSLGFLTWLRRAKEARDENGGYILQQETNAYAILPETNWVGYEEPPQPTVEPWQIGATPPLAPTVDRAALEAQAGNTASAIAVLEEDPKNALALALARLGRAVGLAAKP
jgi:hypothetical protein